jgi:RNA polymerase sigma factor (sigma-70 family)
MIDYDAEQVRSELTGLSSAATPTPGTVTESLLDVRNGVPGAEHQLFMRVIDSLTRVAEIVIGWYPRFRGRAAELVSQIYEDLSEYLSSHDVRNRQHFFRLARKRFNWKILELLRCERRMPEQLLNDRELIARGKGPGTALGDDEERERQRERLFNAIDQLAEQHSQIIHYHFFLGVSFRDIEEELGIPRATAADRCNRALEELAKLMNVPRRGG